jgi:hypothetical protein
VLGLKFGLRQFAFAFALPNRNVGQL